MSGDAGLRRNLKLYVCFRMTAEYMAWMPVFFLYLNQYVPIADVLLLEAIYYLAVVALEVPSGYLSDVVGRRPTLLGSQVLALAGLTAFLYGAEFSTFVAGQFCLAGAVAFMSGTDTSLHFESLSALDESERFAQREAMAKRAALGAGAILVVAGGALGSFDLAAPYVLSLVAAAAALAAIWFMTEPPAERSGRPTLSGFFAQLSVCVARLRDVKLAWLFSFAVTMYVLAHVPYELYQPYLRLLETEGGLGAMDAPAASGLLMAGTLLLGAWAAGRSIQWRDRLGLGSLLLLAAAVQVVIILGLGSLLHPMLAFLVLARSMPMAVVHSPMVAAIAPRIATAERATYFSLQSLASRLAFSLSLALVSLYGEAAQADWPTLAAMLRSYALFGILAWAALALALRRVRL